jgi:hypothetical protein
LRKLTGKTNSGVLQKQMKNRNWLLALTIVILSAALIVTSSVNDSPGYDEPEHITAGYYNVTHQVYWLNVYHPPLSQDLAGLALALLGAKSVHDIPAFKHYRKNLVVDAFMWNQDADRLLQIARTPLIIMSLAFLCYFYKRIKDEFGIHTSLIALTLLAFSPSFLANSRFVGNDVFASASFFVCIFLFFDYLRKPELKNALKLGIATGLALLVKMSLLLLIPLYPFLYFGFFLTGNHAEEQVNQKHWKIRALHCLVTIATAFVLLYGGYAINMAGMNPLFQTWYNFKTFKALRFDPRYDLVQLTAESGLKPLSWYLTGVIAQTHHLTSGHDKASFLQGKLYRGGDFWFFPTVMVAKEPIGYLCLLLFASLTFFWEIKKSRASSSIQALKRLVADNFVVFGSITFVFVYLLIAIRSGLNIGVRHVFPVMPFIYMLTAIGITKSPLPKRAVITFVSICLLAGLASSFLAYPGHLAYFNELSGGKRGGMKIAIDSSYDWGIDLKRLRKFVEENKIPTIYVAYFGRGNPNYYLGPRYRRWSMVELPPTGSYIAVSVQIVEQAIHMNGNSTEIFNRNWAGPPEAQVWVIEWLAKAKSCGVAGDSILIYQIP